METIKNDFLTVEVSSMGAELTSVKDKNGKEYLWQADEKYWNRHSPLLFPIVCGLWEGKYRTEGKEYEMQRHGFARDTEFELLAKGGDKVTYVLQSSKTTLEAYPYNFVLSVTYRLEGNVLHVIWHVFNSGEKEMHFQIGGHPAFNLPDVAKDEPMGGTLRFDNQGAMERLYGNVGGCIVDGRFPFETNNGEWQFQEDSFKDDAVIIDQSQVKQVELLNKEGNAVVTLNFKAPAFGIWSPYGKNAPFVCIEPWYGIHDSVEYKGELKDKYLINHLQPGASFMSEYTITIGA